MKQKKRGLTRDEAAELYKDLQRTMKQMKGGNAPSKKGESSDVARQIAAAISQGMATDSGGAPPKKQDLGIMPFDLPESMPAEIPRTGGSGFKGEYAAIFAVAIFAIFKLVLGALEAGGVTSIDVANASMQTRPQMQRTIAAPGLSREEIKILTSLDQRRVKLEERSKKLDEREIDLDRRDREFAARLTEIRELTNKVQSSRENNQRKRNNQLEQLSNVYGSMNPPEAAQLIEQLDITIALGLLERMPDKRIGQILSLMSPERALALTRMLSGTKEG
jgi:flagellar motility protein MotE (MotC chaperone)